MRRCAFDSPRPTTLLVVLIRLITRRGNDWTTRFPLVVEAVNRLKVRSCLIDGKSRHGMRLNEHLDHPEGDIGFQNACKMRLE